MNKPRTLTFPSFQFLAYHSNGRAYATVLRPSVVCLSAVTLCTT